MAAVASVPVEITMPESRLRAEALDFAIRAGDDKPEDVVARANTYLEFLKGGDNTGTWPE